MIGSWLHHYVLVLAQMYIFSYFKVKVILIISFSLCSHPLPLFLSFVFIYLILFLNLPKSLNLELDHRFKKILKVSLLNLAGVTASWKVQWIACSKWIKSEPLHSMLQCISLKIIYIKEKTSPIPGRLVYIWLLY